MITEHHLPVTRSARYYQQGTPTPRTRQVWFVCHGYGQLAAYFSRHFVFLAEADPDVVVVAPEGLSRFYLQGTGGRVGASWMTRDDRLAEIDDHVAFLNQLADAILGACAAHVQIVVLGFSQGTATVSRWLAQASFHPTHLVLWAGSFPNDLESATAKRLLSGLRLTVVIGSADEYITLVQAEAHLEQLQQLGATPQFVTFEGGHELNRAVLQTLADNPGLPAA